MHEQRNLLEALRREEQDVVRLFRALLAQAEHRRLAMQMIFDRGGSRISQIAIFRLSAILVVACIDIMAPDDPIVSQDERDLLDMLTRVQIRITKSVGLEKEGDTDLLFGGSQQDELEACARALIEIGIHLPKDRQLGIGLSQLL